MATWNIQIPSDKSEERWLTIANCKTIEALAALTTSLVGNNVDGPQIIRIEKWNVPDIPK